MKTRFLATRLIIAGATLMVPGGALANGRYPQTVSVTFQPGNSQRIFVGATFGLVISDDDGATWRWTCEQSIGYSGTWDPVYAVSAPGTIFATTATGLSVSRDIGCTWAFTGGPTAGLWAGDVHVGPDGAVWYVTTAGGLPNDVFVSHDDGANWESTGMLHDRAWWKSVRVAPSDKDRVYVTGYELDDETVDGGDGIPTPLLYRSDDAGATWMLIPFAYQGESQLFLLGVSPVDPETVFARIDGAQADTLLRSTNGGISWTPVLTFSGDGADLVGFVQRKPDGQEIIAGTVAFGTKLSHDGGETWEDPVQTLAMNCVGERPMDGSLFACGANWNPDRIAIGRSTDGGESWVKIMRFIELDDELSCAAGTGHASACAGLWGGLACQFGIGKADAGPDMPDASTVDGGNAVDGGGGDCGCSIGFASVFLVCPWRPRRRRRDERKFNA